MTSIAAHKYKLHPCGVVTYFLQTKKFYLALLRVSSWKIEMVGRVVGSLGYQQYVIYQEIHEINFFSGNKTIWLQ